MSQYNIDEASFELHPSLKDRTVNQFIINDSGPSDFSFVISRAEAFAETAVDAFADTLANEMRKALPKFELLNKRARRRRLGRDGIALYMAQRRHRNASAPGCCFRPVRKR
ncbi:DUF1795 domain-containing protein [Massilia sp. CCM 8694]|uniref:DUF1795 domain-containing protein n=1 Tax=Massilia genomosp. 1 TaxID=2609280 RepID=A0ABX0MRL4_9BURK|nr:DUF1795 domain-containing protein [Massilia genomosp. 1]